MDGARPTFEEAFRAEYAGIVRVVSPIVGSTADAEAVVQDAFVKAFARWPRLARYDRPGAWIQRVAIRDAVRLAQRTRPPEGNPSNDQVPFDVQLGQPLGDRTLVDGACSIEGGAAMSTSFCDPDGVRWEPPTPVDEPPESGATPEARECAAAEGSQIDVAHEPDWRPYADYALWTDEDGCLLRIDVFADRPMPDHCGWGSARVLITGSPIGTPYATADESVHYVRDPDGVLERPGLTESLDLDATVPPEAVDTGYRLGDIEVWHIPGDESFVWVVSPEGVEQWPSGETPVCR